MGKTKSEPQATTCAYCGLVKPLEREHVVPKCLFNKPRPSNMITVLACRDCNEKKGKLDAFLRDITCIDIVGSIDPAADKLLKSTIARSIDRRRNSFMVDFVNRAEWKPIHTSGGIYVGHAYQAKLEHDVISESLSFIIRGLYFHLRKVVIPQNYSICATRIMPFDRKTISNYFEEMEIRLVKACDIGDTFRSYVGWVVEDSLSGIWVVEIFSITFLVFVTPPGGFVELDNT